MRKVISSIITLSLAATVLFTSVPVMAEEIDTTEAEVTIDEVVEDANDITQNNVNTLEEASDIVAEEEVEEDANTEVLVDGMTTYTTSTSMANFAGLGYTNNEQGPISIVKATLVDENGASKEVYVIGLSGTAFVKNQATGVVSDLLAGFNLSNPYLKATVSAVMANIPAGSNLIFTGHSLGGMVAQEAAANKDIKNNYNVLNTVTFGAPLISAGSRAGVTKRLGDKNDIVPYLSITGVILPAWSIKGLNKEDGGYGNVLNFWTAHMGSYCRTDVWGAYDVLGYKNGSATLTYDVSTVSYYKAPTAW